MFIPQLRSHVLLSSGVKYFLQNAHSSGNWADLRRLGEIIKDTTNISDAIITIDAPEAKLKKNESIIPKNVEIIAKAIAMTIILFNLKLYWIAAAAGVTSMAKTKMAPIALSETETTNAISMIKI